MAVLFIASCSDDDKIIDDVQDTITNGAVLRTIAINSNEIPIGIETALFSVLIEEQDNQDGALLDNVNVYVTFEDGSEDEGDSTGATTSEVLLRTIGADQFTTDTPFGLPRFLLEITVQEFIAAVNLSGFEALFGGDVFTTRLELNLTDGRVFSVDNAGGIITGGFFASPFQYRTPVVCPVEEEFFIGEYLVEQITPSIFGYDTFDPTPGDGVILELFNAENAVDANGVGILAQPAEAEALTSTQRAFDATYLAALAIGNPDFTFIMDFVCGETQFLDGQTSGLQCANGITVGNADGSAGFGAYNFEDDSVFNLVFTDDESGDCGGAVQAELRFTKQ